MLGYNFGTVLFRKRMICDVSTEAGLETTHTYQVASGKVHPEGQRGEGGQDRFRSRNCNPLH